MKKNVAAIIWILASVLALLVIVVSLAMWNAHGTVFDVIAGQFSPEPRSLQADISMPTDKEATGYSVKAEVDLSKPVHTLPPEYLSFAFDSSQLVGGKWWNPMAAAVEAGSGAVHAPIFDFNQPELDRLTRALSPAYVRIGGSEADKIYYDLHTRGETSSEVPNGYQSVMTAKEWDDVNAFAQRNGLKLTFTLNAGPSARKSDGSWDGANATELMAYTAQHNFPIATWELGNELNLFWYIYGPKGVVPIGQYARDLKTAGNLARQYTPQAHFAGQGSAFWPILGEPLQLFYGYMPGYLEQAGAQVDQVSWLYYPQQGRRGPIAVRRAYPARLLDPKNLDEVKYWAEKIRQWRDKYAPGKPIWLGETANAQFGGEPGLSDVYLGGLWWLDQLGALAQNGHDVVVRQTLIGSNYGMLNDDLSPRPDYWNSILWKRLMGAQVYSAVVSGENSSRLRLYAQSAQGGQPGSVTILAINIDPQRTASLSFPGFPNRDYDIYRLNAPDIFAPKVLLNGTELKLTADGSVPHTGGETHQGSAAPTISIRSLSYAFIVFH
jgi:heparanase